LNRLVDFVSQNLRLFLLFVFAFNVLGWVATSYSNYAFNTGVIVATIFFEWMGKK